MSVSLEEVLEHAGYDLSITEDATWLLSKQKEFEELIEHAHFIIDEEQEKQDAIAEQEYKNH